MSRRYLHINAVPPGEAPLWVRERWVGLSLPIAQRDAAVRHPLTAGVLSGPRGLLSTLAWLLTGKNKRQSGYIVEARTAIQELEQHAPEAAKWWRENLPHLVRRGRYFVFHESSGYVSEKSEA